MVYAQRKRQRDIQSLQGSLAVGDEVCTTSGLFGTIRAMDDATVSLEVSPGVQLRFDRRAIGLKASPNQAAAQADATDSTSPQQGE
jgi:preprotein translocase subunit YajC